MNQSYRNALAAGTCCLALLLASCGGDGVGARSNTVNALWYGKQNDGSIAQGVTPVTVVVEEIPDGTNFQVDLTGFESAKAGAYWNAAAWNAAAVATLTSASDPRELKVSFSVQEEIDGPSASGLLASAIRADLAGTTIPADRSMTGTILPNGGIGPVADIPAKLCSEAL